MSAHVEESRPASRLVVPALESFLAAGWGPLAAVLAAGFSLGFFAWYEGIVPLHRPTLIQLTLLVFPVAAALAVAVLWTSYSRYFSTRTGVKYQRSLEYDAISWLPFVALWLTFILPFWFTRGGAGLLLYCFAAFCLIKLGFAIRFNLTVREVTIDFVVTRFAIIVIAELAAATIGQRPGTHIQESHNELLNVWGRWDAVHYLDIATVGYHGTDMAFFPLYPVLIAIVGAMIGNHLVAGLIISNVAFFFGLLFLYKLLEHEFDRSVARRGIFYVSIFPTALYFSAVYPEALFFMLTLASFYYMRQRHWWRAGIIGLFAATTRVEGVLLVVPYAIEWASDNWPMLRELYYAKAADAKRAALELAPIVFIPLGLCVYMGYLWVLNGDPLYFSHVQVNWNRHLAAPWTAVLTTIHKISVAASAPPTLANQQTVANQTLELVFTALMIGVLIAGWRKLRPSYIAYMALSILLPLCTSSLMSMPRFALVLFPMFAIFAKWGERPAANNAIVAFSLPLLGLYTVLFADWYWVA